MNRFRFTKRLFDEHQQGVYSRLRPASAESFASQPTARTVFCSEVRKYDLCWGEGCTEAASGFKPVYRR